MPDERLKQAHCGGRWWLRTLKVGVDAGTDYIFKIDPDTKFNRQIRFWPKKYDIFGTLATSGSNRTHIQGGVQVFRRSAAIQLLESGVFRNKRLRDPKTYDWRRRRRGSKRSNYLCTDAMLRAAKIRLTLSWGNWSEVCSQWRYLPWNPKKFALTHPHKRKKLRRVGDADSPSAKDDVANRLFGY